MENHPHLSSVLAVQKCITSSRNCFYWHNKSQNKSKSQIYKQYFKKSLEKNANCFYWHNKSQNKSKSQIYKLYFKKSLEKNA